MEGPSPRATHHHARSALEKQPSSGYFPDMYNNVTRARTAPNSFSRTFTAQIVAGSVTQNAVPGLDGNGANQDWALYVYNAY